MKDPLAMHVIRVVFRVMYALLTRVEYHGFENIPPTGPFLIVTNHLSYADPPLVFMALNRPGLTVLAADTYKKNPLYRWLVSAVRGVWINRGSGDRGALKAALGVLKEGRILGMAPEGTRSRETHALQQGKTGAAFIASKAGVPVLPVALAGTESVFVELKRLRRPRIVFRVGPTFTLPSLDSREDKGKAIDEYTHEIMCHLAALLPEQYHGVYRGDPRIDEIRRATEPPGGTP